jgi:hypothetical protein
MLVVGHPIEDFGGRDAVVVELSDKTAVHRALLDTVRRVEYSLTLNEKSIKSFHNNALAAIADDCC